MTTTFVVFGLLFGSAAFAIDAFNTPESGYVLCVNNKTKAVTFPGVAKCPKGSSRLQLGAQGLPGTQGDQGLQGLAGLPGSIGAQGLKGDVGLTGATGPTGLNGINGLNGLNGSSLLGGDGTPNNQSGNNGDMYIDKNAALLYGPKFSGLWGNPTAFGGPRGATGPKGDPGDAGNTSYIVKNIFSEMIAWNDSGDFTLVHQLTGLTPGQYLLSYKTQRILVADTDGPVEAVFSCFFTRNEDDVDLSFWEYFRNAKIVRGFSTSITLYELLEDEYLIDSYVDITSTSDTINLECRVEGTILAPTAVAPLVVPNIELLLFAGRIEAQAVSGLTVIEAEVDLGPESSSFANITSKWPPSLVKHLKTLTSKPRP